MNSGSLSWQELSDYNGLWVIDRDPQDPWFRYFDSLTQFELSRNAHDFKDGAEPWIFSGAKYLPAATVLLADFSDGAVTSQQKMWQALGSPKALVYSSSKSAFVKKFTSIAPDSFVHIKDEP
jgi:hypothetical protein